MEQLPSQSLECDFVYSGGLATCKSCGRVCRAPAGPVRAKCGRHRAPVTPAGPGTELKALLSKIGIHASPTCKCNKMAQQMDLWGAEESLKHIEEIVDVMQETAKARRLPFLRVAGRKLVQIACARARKKSAQTGQ